MLRLKLEKFRVKIEVDEEISQKFKNPIIFYLAHKDDAPTFLITFAILDFSQKEICYLISYLPENIKELKKYKRKELLGLSHPAYNPHSAIQIEPGKDFYVFNENERYFYYINYQKNYINVFTGEDLPCQKSENLEHFGSTFYRDDEYRDVFYFTAIQNNKKGSYQVNFYKSDIGIKKIELIKELPVKGPGTIPHATRKYKNLLFNSNFIDHKFKFEKSGNIIHGLYKFVRHACEHLYKEYCQEKNINCDLAGFWKKNSLARKKFRFEENFNQFFYSRGKNFLDICRKDEALQFQMLPGEISTINLKNGIVKYYDTTFSSPAHFEIDEKEDCIYASSHNFLTFNQAFFLGPAAIDKFKLIGDDLQKIGTFSEPTSYRMTTHRIFYFKNHPHIATFGQPNRLFIIDAQTMKAVHYEDIGPDFLTNNNNISDFLNETLLEPVTIKTLEASPDGSLLFILSYKCIYIYSMEEKKIIKKIKYQWPIKISEGLMLTDFYKRTTHSDYLD